MPARPPALLSLLRSENQLRVLAALLLHPDLAYTVGELTRQTGVPQPSVSREVANLRRAGLVTDAVEHGRRVVRADTDAAIYPELASLLLKTVGPPAVLERLLAGRRGVERAFIYGSWARRYHGETGEQPGDVDVAVIGQPDPASINALAERASAELGRDVNVVTFTPREWTAARSGFLRRLHASPVVDLRVDAGDEAVG